MDIVNRLKLFMDINKIAISQFADTCNIPRPTMSQILNGRNKKISDELISKIHIAYPHLSVLWLMFGEGEMMQITNMPSSMPQTDGKNGSESPQITDNKQHSLLEMPDFAISENEFKKNPGTEITSEALNHELAQTNTGTLVNHVDKGIGLRNVNARIKNLYGKEYGIQVKSKEGCYTEVQIRIHLLEEDKEVERY